VIPPKHNGSFVAQMELVLDVYKRPFDPKHPVICMDESPKQLIGERKHPISAAPGQLARYDYECQWHLKNRKKRETKMFLVLNPSFRTP